MTDAEREALEALLTFTSIKPGRFAVLDFDALDLLYKAARKVKEERARRGKHASGGEPRSGV